MIYSVSEYDVITPNSYLTRVALVVFLYRTQKYKHDLCRSPQLSKKMIARYIYIIYVYTYSLLILKNEKDKTTRASLRTLVSIFSSPHIEWNIKQRREREKGGRGKAEGEEEEETKPNPRTEKKRAKQRGGEGGASARVIKYTFSLLSLSLSLACVHLLSIESAGAHERHSGCVVTA